MKTLDRKFKKGSIPWNKGMTGFTHLGSFKKGHKPYVGIEKTQFKKREWIFKGTIQQYKALHWWVSYHKGKPFICEFCGRNENLQWANRSHEYLRKVNDWISLCVKCHFEYDGRGLAYV